MDTNSRDDLCRKLSCLVEDAHTALADLRSHNAEQAFSRALELLETFTPKVNAQASNICTKTSVFFVVTKCLFPQDLGLSSLDVMLLLFGRALALIESGQPEVVHTRVIASVAIFCHFIVNPNQIMSNRYNLYLFVS